MPHRRHRVRVHVHNRYVRTAEPNRKTGKKSCKKRGNNRQGRDADDERNTTGWRSDDDAVALSPTAQGRRKEGKCTRYWSAEEVCGRSTRDGERRRPSPCQRRQLPEYPGSPCQREAFAEHPDSPRQRRQSPGYAASPRQRQASAEYPDSLRRRRHSHEYSDSPCQRFQSAEETCRGCNGRPAGAARYPQSFRSVPDVQLEGGGRRNSRRDGADHPQYSVYTALLQQTGRCASGQPVHLNRRPPPPTDDPNCVIEEIVHSREHSWHIPRLDLAADRRSGARQNSTRLLTHQPSSEKGARRNRCLHPVPKPSDDNLSVGKASPCRHNGRPQEDQGAAKKVEEAKGTAPDISPVTQIPHTQSELLMGRRLVERIAQQVELDEPRDHLVYHLTAQYGVADLSGSQGSLTEPATVVRLQLESDSSQSDSEPSVGCSKPTAAPPTPADRTRAADEPPSPLPRRQVTSEPALPAPPEPSMRQARSLESQARQTGGRVKKLRTRGALTRLRHRSSSRPDDVRQVAAAAAVTQSSRTSKPTKDPTKGPPQTTAGAASRGDAAVYHAQNLLPAAADAIPPQLGSRGDGEMGVIYSDPYTNQALTTTNDVPNKFDGASQGWRPDPGPYGQSQQPDQLPEYGSRNSRYGGNKSPYLDTPPPSHAGQVRFDDSDELGSALYEQRYQPRHDYSPYLTRPAPSPRAATQPASRLTRSGGQQQLGRPTNRGGLGQRLTRSWTSLKERGKNIYQHMSGRVGRGRGRGKGQTRGRGAAKGGGRPAGGGTQRRQGRHNSDISCTDSDSECGAVNCSFLFYFNGDGEPSNFMPNMLPVRSGEGQSNNKRGGYLSKKYCSMCEHFKM